MNTDNYIGLAIILGLIFIAAAAGTIIQRRRRQQEEPRTVYFNAPNLTADGGSTALGPAVMRAHQAAGELQGALATGSAAEVYGALHKVTTTSRTVADTLEAREHRKTINQQRADDGLPPHQPTRGRRRAVVNDDGGTPIE